MTSAQPGQEQRMEQARKIVCESVKQYEEIAGTIKGTVGIWLPLPDWQAVRDALTRPTAEPEQGMVTDAILKAAFTAGGTAAIAGVDAQDAWRDFERCVPELSAARPTADIGEELEAAYREGWIDGYHNGRGCSVIDPGPDWLESDARAVLSRSGG